MLLGVDRLAAHGDLRILVVQLDAPAFELRALLDVGPLLVVQRLLLALEPFATRLELGALPIELLEPLHHRVGIARTHRALRCFAHVTTIAPRRAAIILRASIAHAMYRL